MGTDPWQLESSTFKSLVVQHKSTLFPVKQFYLIPLMIYKDIYLSAYRAASYLCMYQSAQTIKALSHVGSRVVKIIPEGGAERKHLSGSAHKLNSCFTVESLVAAGNCKITPPG
jgi:hypothetical protein